MIKLEEFRALPLYKIVPIESELTEIAVTDEPAIGEFFLLFSKEEIKVEFNDEKRIIKAPVMIPGLPIYRNDSLGERFVIYDEEGVKTAAELFMRNGLLFNADHTDEYLQINVLESYFTTEDNEFGVPAGSWVISAKVNSDELWNKFKTNKHGFSVQFLTRNELIGVHKFNDDMPTLREKLLQAINSVLFETQEVEVKVVVESEPEPVIEPVIEPEITQEEIVQLLTQFKLDIISQVDLKLEAFKIEMGVLSAKLEEFSNQPINTSITEEAQNLNLSELPKAAKFFTK